MQKCLNCATVELKSSKRNVPKEGHALLLYIIVIVTIPWQVTVNLPTTPVAFKCKKPGAFGIERNGQELTHGKDVK